MKIAVAFNDDTSLKATLSDIEKMGESEVIESASEVCETLGRRHETRLFPVRDSVVSAVDDLRQFEPDVVFNLCEGVLGKPSWESHFVALLEMLGFPFTGCAAVELQLCQDKPLLKRLLTHAGVSTPAGVEVRVGETGSFEGLTFPLIVKPSREDGGIGIGPESIVDSAIEAERRCAVIHETYRESALAEEFIEGGELNLSLFLQGRGYFCLPPGEVLFGSELSARERIVGAKAKWAAGSREDLATQNRTPAEVHESVKRGIEELCVSAARLIGIQGYCRFDLRQDAAGKLFIVDVNPNPDLGAGSGFRKALDAAGIEYLEFLEILAGEARNRASGDRE